MSESLRGSDPLLEERAGHDGVITVQESCAEESSPDQEEQVALPSMESDQGAHADQQREDRGDDLERGVKDGAGFPIHELERNGHHHQYRGEQEVAHPSSATSVASGACLSPQGLDGQGLLGCGVSCHQ